MNSAAQRVRVWMVMLSQYIVILGASYFSPSLSWSTVSIRSAWSPPAPTNPSYEYILVSIWAGGSK
eukprot:4898468-Pyramimonas_sp.AAC.1